MALPKINNVPKYEVVVPSLNKSAWIRPYYVKEEKVLLIAMESNDSKIITKATTDMVDACLEGIDTKVLTAFDYEYLFMYLRSISVGETSTVFGTCTGCQEQNEITIDLTKVEITPFDSPKTIQLTKDISIEIRYPPLQNILNNDSILNAESYTDRTLHSVVECMHSVQTAEELILFKNETYEEIVEFIDSFTVEQFKQLREFVDNVPTVALAHAFTCTNCGHENNLLLEGVQDFFE